MAVIGPFLTFGIPFLYILSSVQAAIVKDGSIKAYHRLISVFQLVYAIPVLMYALFERPLIVPYLSPHVTLLKHNHYGWASLLFLVLSVDLLSNVSIPNWRKWLTIALLPMAYYLFLASGNRATWVSGAATVLIFLARWQHASFDYKVRLVAFGALPLWYFLAYPGSAVYEAIERTSVQLKYGTATSERLLWAMSAFNDLLSHPGQWLTGRGMFNYVGLINPHSYHNSYYEILFGCGLPVFLLFAYGMVWKPFQHYWNGYSTRYLTFFPLLIIPFFESNLTGGQFLFYPWFTFMIFYYLTPHEIISGEKNAI